MRKKDKSRPALNSGSFAKPFTQPGRELTAEEREEATSIFMAKLNDGEVRVVEGVPVRSYGPFSQPTALSKRHEGSESLPGCCAATTAIILAALTVRINHERSRGVIFPDFVRGLEVARGIVKQAVETSK